ncbi:MAG: hypothetical protein KGL39_07515 [Patescibacteria group bacterium]|nr:hypothetical protein [Patescibacteria group bacterium]
MTQSGVATPGHLYVNVVPSVAKDAGTPSNPQVNSLGMYNGPNYPFCINSLTSPGAPASGTQYALLCMGISNSQATITLQGNNGLATPPFYMNINGTLYPFPGSGSGNVVGPSSSTDGDLAVFNGVTGTLIKDSKILPNGTTATTQSPGNNSDEIATTGYVDRVVDTGARAYSFLVQTALGTYEWIFGVVSDAGIGVSTSSCAYASCLRTNTTPWPTVYVQGYYGPNSLGGGTFRYVSSDSSSPDNGSTIIVDASGDRYYRDYVGALPVEDSGAVCSSSTDSHSDLDAIPSGISVHFTGNCPVGTSTTFSLASHPGSYGDGMYSGSSLTQLVNPSTGPVPLVSGASGSSMQNMALYGCAENSSCGQVDFVTQASFSASASSGTLTITSGSVTGTIAAGETILCDGAPVGITISSGSGLSWTLSSSVTFPLVACTAAMGATSTQTGAPIWFQGTDTSNFHATITGTATVVEEESAHGANSYSPVVSCTSSCSYYTQTVTAGDDVRVRISSYTSGQVTAVLSELGIGATNDGIVLGGGMVLDHVLISGSPFDAVNADSDPTGHPTIIEHSVIEGSLEEGIYQPCSASILSSALYLIDSTIKNNVKAGLDSNCGGVNARGNHFIGNGTVGSNDALAQIWFDPAGASRAGDHWDWNELAGTALSNLAGAYGFTPTLNTPGSALTDFSFDHNYLRGLPSYGVIMNAISTGAYQNGSVSDNDLSNLGNSCVVLYGNATNVLVAHNNCVGYDQVSSSYAAFWCYTAACTKDRFIGNSVSGMAPGTIGYRLEGDYITFIGNVTNNNTSAGGNTYNVDQADASATHDFGFGNMGIGVTYDLYPSGDASGLQAVTGANTWH